jgi:hypothetical protein
MSGIQPWKLILIGFVLVLFGAVAPFLMVMRVVESSLILNFLSYGASMVGLFLGLIGAALYVRIHRS